MKNYEQDKIENQRILVIKDDKVMSKSRLIKDEKKLQELYKKVITYEERKYFKKRRK